MDGTPLFSRRQAALLLAAAGIGAACKKEEATTDTAALDTSITTDTAATLRSGQPIRVADVHVHLFNANFLPIDGVFAKWVSGTLAGIVARLITAKVDECLGSVSSLSSVSAADTALRELENATDDQLIEHLYRTTPATAFGDSTFVSSLNSVSATPRSRDELDDMTDAERRLALRAEFVTTLNQAADQRPQELFPERGGFLQWIALMTWCEHRIWAAAQAAYPSVNLFVAHMMDMENYYKPSKPKYAYPDKQVLRMLNLAGRSNGKVLPFVAFDPLRDDWEEIVGDALAAGCAGVKFYPPNGYAPFDTTAGKVPKNTEGFFRYCIRNKVPVFTHTTTHGFESISGYGKKYADPKLWRSVLSWSDGGTQPFRDLQLCFAHAGGEAGWFPKEGAAPMDSAPFSAEVVALCREFPNVYCEVAYLSPILTPQGRTRFQAALRTATTPGGTFNFGRKVMYGSDWHMIHKLKNHRAYLPAFIEALSAAEWDGLRDDFFFNNAIRWLDLRAYVARLEGENPPVLSGSAITYLRELATGAS